ncbi:MAG: 2'-5' RNA ligase family protein [Flavobacteriales bacterium]|nr:2'-5' RNA ligase family protein [Flavobacteriales bacterium]
MAPVSELWPRAAVPLPDRHPAELGALRRSEPETFCAASRDRSVRRIPHRAAHHPLPPDLPDGNEPAIVEAAADGAASCPSFNLHYSGITHFPERRTIYIDPVQKNDIGKVRSAIIVRLMADPDLRDAVRVTTHPHLTVAAGLKPMQFNTAWALLAPHEHASEERVSEIVLLKRLLREGERYAMVRSFALRG